MRLVYELSESSLSLQIFLFLIYYSIIFLLNKSQEAAYDADKVYLAAIDKFDAILSRGNVHAPEGMLNF